MGKAKLSFPKCQFCGRPIQPSSKTSMVPALYCQACSAQRQAKARQAFQNRTIDKTDKYIMIINPNKPPTIMERIAKQKAKILKNKRNSS